MVSQLSARLLADYSDASRSGSASGSSSDGERSSSGGYSADREGSRTSSPPGHLKMHVKRSFSSDSNERTKRRKLNEEQYAASVAKEDMEKGGATIRPIETERSRIALGKVDMSRVKLVRSEEVESSPFLIPASPHMAHIKYDFTAESVYNTLINSCRRAYELLDAIDTESDSSDSTSSFSDVESDFGQGWKKDAAVIIKPRIEDSIPATTTASEPCPSTMFVEQEASPPPEVSMTMNEALTVCKFSRCVAI
jgi:hypothetical protein